jgi:HAD superfamily hydrolase (TIGR01549 family)
MRPRFKAALFDLDDTLFDHQFHRRQALTALRDVVAIDPSVTLAQLEEAHDVHLQRTHHLWLAGDLTLEAARRERLHATLRTFGVDADEAALRACEATYRSEYDREWRPIPGATALLQALKDAGVWIGLITNGGSREQRHKVEVLGLQRWLDGLFISAEMGCEKPSTEYFDRALAGAGVTAGECIVVGDFWPNDIAGGLAAGCEAIWLNRYQRTGGPHPRVREVTGWEPLAEVLPHFC